MINKNLIFFFLLVSLKNFKFLAIYNDGVKEKKKIVKDKDIFFFTQKK